MTKRRLIYISAVSLAASGLGACTKEPDQAALNGSVQNYWRECSAVQPGAVTVLTYNKNVVRYTYVARLAKGGAAIQLSACPQKNQAMLQAVANVDFKKIPAGSSIVVTVEQDRATGSDTIVMPGLSR